MNSSETPSETLFVDNFYVIAYPTRNMSSLPLVRKQFEFLSTASGFYASLIEKAKQEKYSYYVVEIMFRQANPNVKCYGCKRINKWYVGRR